MENIDTFNDGELLRPVRERLHTQYLDVNSDLQTNSEQTPRRSRHSSKKEPAHQYKSKKPNSKKKKLRWKPILWMIFSFLTVGIFGYLYLDASKHPLSFSKILTQSSTLLLPLALGVFWFSLFMIMLFITSKKLGTTVLLLLLVLANTTTYALSDQAYQIKNFFDQSSIKSAIPASSVNVSVSPFTVLILGVDADDSNEPKSSTQPGSGYRSDSMILVTINPQTHKADMISTPRDTFLQDSCKNGTGGVHKLTEFIGGGVQCTIDTLQSLYDVKIDFYIQANFNAVVQIVDALGGVELNVPDLTPSYISWLSSGGLGGEDGVTPSQHQKLISKAKSDPQWCEVDSHRNPYTVCFNQFGTQTLDGEHALAFSRSRHYDSDYARGIRQTEAIRAIIQKMASIDGLFKINPILDRLKRNYSIETNMDFDRMTAIMSYAGNLSGNDTAAFQVRKHQPLGKESSDPTAGSGIYLYKYSVLDIRKSIAMTLNLDKVPPAPVQSSDYYDTIEYPAFKTNE